MTTVLIPFDQQSNRDSRSFHVTKRTGDDRIVIHDRFYSVLHELSRLPIQTVQKQSNRDFGWELSRRYIGRQNFLSIQTVNRDKI